MRSVWLHVPCMYHACQQEAISIHHAIYRKPDTRWPIGREDHWNPTPLRHPYVGGSSGQSIVFYVARLTNGTQKGARVHTRYPESEYARNGCVMGMKSSLD